MRTVLLTWLAVASLAAAAPASPADRIVDTIQNAACFTTCLTAGFSASTTCTFGLILQVRRSCAQVFPLAGTVGNLSLG